MKFKYSRGENAFAHLDVVSDYESEEQSEYDYDFEDQVD